MAGSSRWFVTCTKLRFFSRIRRFLQIKTSKKRKMPSDWLDQSIVIDMERGKEDERREKEDGAAALQRAVKSLHFGGWEEKEAAAKEIKKLAGEDPKARRVMAELGVVPPLVAMVGSEAVGRRRLAIQALIELANGNYTNKALIVEAGVLSRLSENVGASEETITREFAELLLAISSLGNSQFPLTSSKTISFLITILNSNSSIATKELCLSTLYNLSTKLENAGCLVTNGAVETLLELSRTKETSEKALATLGNLGVTLVGKKAVENNPMVPESLIEILTWEDEPKCQEFAVYILMILAHQNSVQRQKMAKSGIVPVLLEVALLGSPLAQKRAMKLLQWFKDERQTRIGPHSGPQTGRIVIGSPVNPREVNEGKTMMNRLVKQSLYKNMETITRRAYGAEDSSSKLKTLIVSSSCKSLPY